MTIAAIMLLLVVVGASAGLVYYRQATEATLIAFGIFIVSLILLPLWGVGFIFSPITSPQQFRRDLNAFLSFAHSLLAPYFKRETDPK